MATKLAPGDEIVSDQDMGYLVIDIGDGAQMTCPTGELEWQMRYGDPEKFRMIAASALDSFEYLVCHCSRDEAWRRIQLMRKAVRKFHSEKTK